MTKKTKNVKLADWQQRVIAEGNELCGRLSKLSVFTVSAEFRRLPKAEQSLLLLQQSAMTTYLAALSARTEYWNTKKR